MSGNHHLPPGISQSDPDDMSVFSESRDEFERGIQCYVFALFRVNKRGHRFFHQRGLIVSNRSIDQLELELEAIIQQINDNEKRRFSYELVEAQKLLEHDQPLYPTENYVISLSEPLKLFRRSPATGEVYDDPEMQYCPHTRGPLYWFVGAINTTHKPDD